MTVIALPLDSELARIQALLDRMDPQPHVCGVAGCVHLHDEREHVPAAA
jgi:hypothetical protein